MLASCHVLQHDRYGGTKRACAISSMYSEEGEMGGLLGGTCSRAGSVSSVWKRHQKNRYFKNNLRLQALGKDPHARSNMIARTITPLWYVLTVTDTCGKCRTEMPWWCKECVIAVLTALTVLTNVLTYILLLFGNMCKMILINKSQQRKKNPCVLIPPCVLLPKWEKHL